MTMVSTEELPKAPAISRGLRESSFRLAVPRRPQEHQTVDLAALDPFELRRDQSMVPAVR